jgi:LacI family transcriptional regulator
MASGNMIQLKRIAEEASVSIGTVSRVLSNKAQVSEKTRKRVLKVAKDLDYRPNRLVHAIQSGKTQTIGVLLNPSQEVHANILKGIQEELHDRDHLALAVHGRKLDPDHPEVTNELQLLQRLIEHRVDGIIICPMEDRTPDDAKREPWMPSLPMVSVDRRLPGTDVDFVGIDDLEGARQVMDYLFELGHRRIAHITGPSSFSTWALRRQGYEKAMRDRGLSPVVEVDPAHLCGLDQARRLLSASPRPTAIFVSSDLTAMAVYQAATEMGLSIPHDLSVVGFADMRFSRLVTPALTSVKQFPHEVGKRAVSMMFDRMAGKFPEGQPQSICLEPELVVRQSCAPVKSK